jgi:hypothetical protein
VKRYLRELSDHLADLTETQSAAGLNAPDAAMMARAKLGSDAELADAMLKQRDFRSVSARFPWAVFGVMPPVAVIVAFFLLLPLMIILGHLGGAIGTDNKLVLPVPAWFDWTMTTLVFLANLLIGTALAFLLARMAQRQRMKLVWPLAGMALILILGVRGSFHAGDDGISFNLSTLLVSYRGFGSAVFPYHWPTFLTQAALLCMPLAWLIRHRPKPGAPA